MSAKDRGGRAHSHHRARETETTAPSLRETSRVLSHPCTATITESLGPGDTMSISNTRQSIEKRNPNGDGLELLEEGKRQAGKARK